MDRNSVVGYVLIAIVLVTFYLINRPSAEQIAEQARIRDSIAYMQQLDLQMAELEKQAEQQRQDSIQMSMPQRQEEFKVLENEVLKLTFSNKGGKIYKAELKNYQRFGDSINPLCLFEGDEYREMVSRYDRNRHNAHEDAIANVRLVNRLATMYDSEPLFTGDDQERLQVADFCLDVTVQIFQNRIMQF